MGINIHIYNNVALNFFRKLNIDVNNSYLMDVKKAIFKFYNLPEPVIIIKKSRKTISQQKPNQSYGIPYTIEERELFIRKFGFDKSDPNVAEKINKKIISDIISSEDQQKIELNIPDELINKDIKIEHEKIKLTQGNLNFSPHIYVTKIRNSNPSFFPSDSYGGENKSLKGKEFTIITDLADIFNTDIDTKPILRNRSGTRKFLENRFKAGDTLNIYRVRKELYYFSKYETSEDKILSNCRKVLDIQGIEFPDLKLKNDIDVKEDYSLSAVDLEEPPNKYKTVVDRIIRDTSLIRELKVIYQDKCQICEKKIKLKDKNYSEGHHLQPLGGIHDGLDIKENIIILCPNHHAEFDYGAIAINPYSSQIEHVNVNNGFIGKKPILKHNIDFKYFQYHFEKIFKDGYSIIF